MRPADDSDIQEPSSVEDWIFDDFIIVANELQELKVE